MLGSIKAVWITVALALVGGGMAWGKLNGQTDEIGRIAEQNRRQIERMSEQLSAIYAGQQRIDERTQQILMRLQPIPPQGR